MLATALAVRLASWSAFAGSAPRGDEVWYWQSAGELADGSLGLLSRGPGQVAFLGALRALGCGIGEARLASLMLSLLLPLVIWDLGRRLGGRWSGLVAGIGCGVAPALSSYAHFLWSENLTTLALWVGLWCLVRGRNATRQEVWCGLGGAALGVAVLAREQWLVYALATVAWVALARNRVLVSGRRAGLLVLLGVAAVVLPWMVRNASVAGRFVGIGTQRWFPVAAGNLYPEDDWFLGANELDDKPELADSEERERYWRQVALDAVKARWPSWLWRKPLRNGSRLLGLHSQTVRFVEKGWIARPRWAAGALVAYDVVFTMVILSCGLVALVLTAGRGDLPLVAVLVYVALVHGLANAVPRFLVPAWPLLLLFVGRAAGTSRAAWRDRNASRVRVWLAVTVLSALVGSWTVRWATDVGAAWRAL